VRALSDDAIVTDGELRLIAGVRSYAGGGLSVGAEHFAVGAETLLMVGGEILSIEGVPQVRASAPVDLSLDLVAGTGVVEASQDCALSIRSDGDRAAAIDGQTGRIDEQGRAHFELGAGRHELTGDLSVLSARLAAIHQAAWRAAEAAPPAPEPEPTRPMAPAWTAELPATVSALEAGDLDGDGAQEFVAGCEDGTLVALNAAGDELWRAQLGGRVNDIEVAQIEPGDAPELAVGAEDSHLHVLAADGGELWKRYVEAHRAEGGTDGHVRVVRVADFDADGTPDIAIGCANTFFYVLDNRGEVKSTDGGPWEHSWRHKASAIAAADLTGDGRLELLTGYGYFSQWILDFTKSGRARTTVVPSGKSGTSAITAADVDGDGLAEAIYADADGQVTACSVAPAGERNAAIAWANNIGDDRLAAVVAEDLDADGSPEIAPASYSGFLALLGAGGEVKWVRYADNRVTDAAPAAPGAIARSSRDGTVAIYGASGGEPARWNAGEPLRMLAVDREREQPLLVAAGERTLRAARWTP